MIPGRRTSEGQLVITAGPPLSTDPRLAGFALKPTGEIYASGGQSAFTPADLFLNGEQGAWYDPSDLTTMFQDSAGTVPVTADGQPVGKILDKSGHGNHASQSTAAARPLYKTDGTYHWLQFDGVDDSLSTAAIDLSTVNNLSAFHGIYANTPNTLQLPWAIGDNPDGTTGSFGHYISYAVAGNNAFGGKPSTGLLINGVPSPVSYKSVASDSLDQSAPTAITQAKTRLNGVDKSMSTLVGTLLTGSPFSTLPLYIGFRQAGNDMRFNGNIYSLIIRGALSSQAEIDETEPWVNSKTGAY